jgi:hypothetical protein
LLILLNEPLNELLVLQSFLILLFLGLPDPASFFFEHLGEVPDLVQEPELLDFFLEDDLLAPWTVLIFTFWLLEQDGVHTFFAGAMLLWAEDHREHSIVIVLFRAQWALKVRLSP